MSRPSSPSAMVFGAGVCGLALTVGLLLAVSLSPHGLEACLHMVVGAFCLAAASLYAVTWGALRLRRGPRPRRAPDAAAGHAPTRAPGSTDATTDVSLRDRW